MRTTCLSLQTALAAFLLPVAAWLLIFQAVTAQTAPPVLPAPAAVQTAPTAALLKDPTTRQYPSTVIHIVDADTLDLVVDHGLGLYSTQRLRLLGVDAWEVTGAEKEKGLAAKAYVLSRIPETSSVLLLTDGRKGKYGRLLAVILYLDENGKACNLNEELLQKGHGEPYE